MSRHELLEYVKLTALRLHFHSVARTGTKTKGAREMGGKSLRCDLTELEKAFEGGLGHGE